MQGLDAFTPAMLAEKWGCSERSCSAMTYFAGMVIR